MNSSENTSFSDRAYIETVWSSYFSSAGDQLGDQPPLPETGIDLLPFIRDIIPGKRETPWAARARNIVEHFQNLEPEFRGFPRITHLMACSIVSLRRNQNEPAALDLFWKILNEAGPEVAEHLNSRWLTSICDTVVDTAENDLDRAMALVGTVFISTIKMAETELRLYRPQRGWPPKKRLRHGGEIYDGVQSLWTEGMGDVENIFNRIDRGLTVRSSVTPVLKQLISRAVEGNTFINRIIGTTGQKRLPMAPEETLKQLRDIMRSL